MGAGMGAAIEVRRLGGRYAAATLLFLLAGLALALPAAGHPAGTRDDLPTAGRAAPAPAGTRDDLPTPGRAAPAPGGTRDDLPTAGRAAPAPVGAGVGGLRLGRACSPWPSSGCWW
ncbi:hypothetical protein Ate01nite_48890 [Actinoplanes teichomyceticus]|nr:hypothetical protein Ate01nite_48890 [Actinoplanes teichomyceticus]